VDEVAGPLLPLVSGGRTINDGPVVAIGIVEHVLLGNHDVAVARSYGFDHGNMALTRYSRVFTIPHGDRTDGGT